MTRYAPLWQQAGSYPAQLDRALIAALYPRGAVVGGAVTAVANTMNVSAAPGLAAVPLSAAGDAALCRWDAAEIVPLAAAPPSGQSRYDVVIVQVRDAQLDAGPNNDFIVTVVQGAPAASAPAVPATPANALALCTVLVPGAAANLNGATLSQPSFTAADLSPVPAGRVFLNQNLNLTSGQGAYSPTAPQMSTDYMRGGCLRSGAGIQVPVSGVYEFSVSLWIQLVAPNAGANFYTSVLRNNAAFLQLPGVSVTAAANPFNPAVLSSKRFVNAGDVFIFNFAAPASGGPHVLRGDAVGQSGAGTDLTVTLVSGGP